MLRGSWPLSGASAAEHRPLNRDLAIGPLRPAAGAPPRWPVAPCALGGAHPGIDELLADRGMLYAPDYVVNSGGVTQVADEIEGSAFAWA
ncbi:hypothetical protein GCM10020369_64380 [Cryptosporangium minutisporangium]|uniref:Glutamate/phenylalanine/leucine/valine dehydrogenase C-terminal domain-containing protein n=1 Tax=Cryptosporangium minutisporangium TaxID=113569 RepID=A0ABP6T7M7_9ACTN